MINIKHIKLSLKKLVKLWTFFSQFYEDHQDQGDVTVYKNVFFKEKMLEHLAEASNKLYKNIKNKEGITEKIIESSYD